MKEQDVKDLGFTLKKNYKHDEFNTNVYEMIPLQLDFTYKGRKLISVDLFISEVDFLKVSIDELKQLKKILIK